MDKAQFNLEKEKVEILRSIAMSLKEISSFFQKSMEMTQQTHAAMTKSAEETKQYYAEMQKQTEIQIQESEKNIQKHYQDHQEKVQNMLKQQQT